MKAWVGNVIYSEIYQKKSRYRVSIKKKKENRKLGQPPYNKEDRATVWSNLKHLCLVENISNSCICLHAQS